jgi:hypothetical protein
VETKIPFLQGRTRVRFDRGQKIVVQRLQNVEIAWGHSLRCFAREPALDFSWFLASAGGTRFAAALGAESIKVEWKENPDTRLAAMAPVGGREARKSATAPLPGVSDTDMGGQYNNKNSGKRGISLNIRRPKGLDIARRLVAISDIVAEGFSPGVLDRLGLGYGVQRKIRPDIIYVQQSGMGDYGSYGRLRTVARSPPRSPEPITCRVSPSPRCRPGGAIPSSIGWALTASRRRCSAPSITAR